MLTVHDIASYILEKTCEISAMKLQKLVYYAQAWALVWDEEPLFEARIEAWANGPVIPSLYEIHRGEFKISKWPLGNPRTLSPKQMETVDTVIETYGQYTAQQLSDFTHREDPWIIAREGIAMGERSDREISIASIAEYYSGLYLEQSRINNEKP